MARKSKNKPLKNVIGIYCEGPSEVEYFKMLRRKYRGGNVQTHQVGLEIESMNSMKGTKIITEIIDKVRFLKRKRQVNFVFAVFDRDDLSNEDIQRSLALAKKNNIKVIFSSTNFEVWILLHFQFFSRAYSKDDLNRILSDLEHFNKDYSTFKGSEYDQYLFDKVSTAIRNARQLYKKNDNLLLDNPFVNIQDYIKEIFGRED